MYLIKIGKNRLMDWSLADVHSTLPSQILEKWLVGVTVQKQNSGNRKDILGVLAANEK
jgi:hypothetical protein